jgi:hypothetical protein
MSENEECKIRFHNEAYCDRAYNGATAVLVVTQGHSVEWVQKDDGHFESVVGGPFVVKIIKNAKGVFEICKELKSDPNSSEHLLMESHLEAALCSASTLLLRLIRRHNDYC